MATERDSENPVIGPNPYLNRVAIKDPSQFFGRTREVSKIFSRLGASRPQSLSIVGDRRIGKSSLLYYISNKEIRSKFLDRPESYIFAFIDLQQRRNLTLNEFFNELITLIGREIQDNGPARPGSGFDLVRSLLERFRAEGKKLIVLFDEFDAISTNQAFDLEFYSFLRSLANNYDVAYVTSSARDLHDLCRSQLIADSPFFNIFTNVFLRPFSRLQAMDLITKPSAAAGLTLEGYARRIMELGGYFPYFLQIACSAFFDYLTDNEGRANQEEIEAAFLDEAKGQFRFIWDHVSERSRRCIRDFIAHGQVSKEQEHVYQELRRAGFFIEDDRGTRVFSTLFSSVVSRPKIVTAELEAAALAETTTMEDEEKTTIMPPLIEPAGYIGRFNILRSLGSGGMGEIFEGLDTRLHRTVAIKVLAAKYVEDDAMKQRFLREARMASQLNHQNIATIYEIGEAAGNPFIVMEYVEGQTLADRLSSGQLGISCVIDIGKQAADALAEAHEHGVVHRDIKSANIMITPKGKVKILDFGLARPSPLTEKFRMGLSGKQERLTESGILLGTVNYMSPEQASGSSEVSHLSDIFSLGVVLYEATTGYLPFEGDTYFQTIEAINKHEPPPITNYRSDTPPELVSVIGRMLAKSPAERYQSATEVLFDLEKVVI